MTPVAIGDTQGTLQARKTCITPYKRQETLVWLHIWDHCSHYKDSFIFNIYRRHQSFFVGSPISLFWSSGNVCPGFQSHGGSSLAGILACMQLQRYYILKTCRIFNTKLEYDVHLNNRRIMHGVCHEKPFNAPEMNPCPLGLFHHYFLTPVLLLRAQCNFR